MELSTAQQQFKQCQEREQQLLRQLSEERNTALELQSRLQSQIRTLEEQLLQTQSESALEIELSRIQAVTPLQHENDQLRRQLQQREALHLAELQRKEQQAQAELERRLQEQTRQLERIEQLRARSVNASLHSSGLNLSNIDPAESSLRISSGSES